MLQGSEVVATAIGRLHALVTRLPGGDALVAQYPDLIARWLAVDRVARTPADWAALREAVLTWRYLVLSMYEGQERDLIALVATKPVPHDPLDLASRILTWCWLLGTAEGDEREDGAKIAFIPFPVQVEVLARFCWLMLGQPDKGRDLAILKSRQT